MLDLLLDLHHDAGIRSLTDACVLLLIERHTRGKWCTRSQTSLAIDLGVCRKTIRRAEQRLATAGLIESRPAFGNGRTRKVRRTGQSSTIRERCT